MRRNIYFSNDWSLPFYLAQAYHGFIATAYAKQGQPALLLPEMQLSYAVLQHEVSTSRVNPAGGRADID